MLAQGHASLAVTMPSEPGVRACVVTERRRVPSVILFCSHASPGGVRELLTNIGQGYRKRGLDVRLMALYPFHEAGEGDDHEAQAWEYVVRRRPTRLDTQFRLLVGLVRMFRSSPPDLVITAQPAANVLVPFAVSLAQAHTRVVISHHSPVSTYNRLLNVVDGLTGSLEVVKSVVCVSNAVKESLSHKPAGYRAKRRTIHNALPPNIESHLARLSRARVRSAGRCVVAMGRLVEQKNYPVLLRAAVHMPDVHVLIVGDGPDEAMLKAMAIQLGVAERVAFLGRKRREEALEILAAGDVFVQPSLFEGHSLALIEAAALGLPLVVSDVPVQLEGITATDGTVCGITHPSHDDGRLACEILRLLDDSEHYAASARLASHLAESFTFDCMMAAYEQLVAA